MGTKINATSPSDVAEEIIQTSVWQRKAGCHLYRVCCCLCAWCTHLHDVSWVHGAGKVAATRPVHADGTTICLQRHGGEEDMPETCQQIAGLLHCDNTEYGSGGGGGARGRRGIGMGPGLLGPCGQGQSSIGSARLIQPRR